MVNNPSKNNQERKEQNYNFRVLLTSGIQKSATLFESKRNFLANNFV